MAAKGLPGEDYQHGGVGQGAVWYRLFMLAGSCAQHWQCEHCWCALGPKGELGVAWLVRAVGMLPSVWHGCSNRVGMSCRGLGGACIRRCVLVTAAQVSIAGSCT